VAAQGTGPDYAEENDGENLVLRHVKYPEADVIDLLPLQDSYITSSRPDQNYGQDLHYWVGYDLDRTGGGAQRPYSQWDISPIPDFAIINSAEYWFAIADSRPSGDSAMSAEVRHLLGSWSENVLTWKQRAGRGLGWGRGVRHDPRSDWLAISGCDRFGKGMGQRSAR